MFDDTDDTMKLGSPVVGLFRTALARDPGPAELERFAQLVKARVPTATIADRIVQTAEFRERYGDLPRSELSEALLDNAFGRAPQSYGTARLAAALDGTEAELVATISEAALARGAVPLLPGLAPGAPPDDRVAYELWTLAYGQEAAAGAPVTSDPLISLLAYAGDTDAEALAHSVRSLQAQDHAAWELCLAVRTLSPWSRELVEALCKDDRRVRLAEEHSLPAAFGLAGGALVALIEPGDRLAPTALSAVATAFADEPGLQLVFSDEDVWDESGRHSPRFKPGFSPDALLGGDAIGQLAVFRRERVEAADLAGETPLRSLAARLGADLQPAEAHHLSAVLLHRRRTPPPIPLAPRPAAAMPDPPPLVTAVVLTKDKAALLKACTDGVLDRTAYRPLQLVLVDNGTTEPDALRLIEELETRPNVRVIRQPGPFNFAALNNEAAETVGEGVLLLLNNDVEVLDENWLSEMVAQVSRPGVGAVGARLLYPDGTVQHAGMLLGPDGRATHVGRGAAPDAPGYMGQLSNVRDLSAVTGACLAIPVATWRRVGGMDERLAVAWNDVDLCLRVREAGLRVLYTPRATLLHRESSTRGLEAHDPAQQARFEAERAIVQARWGDAMERDPFLNRNLVALDSGALVLTRPRSATQSVA